MQSSTIYKVIVVGDEGCGKSTLCHYYSHREHEPAYVPTIGVDFKVRILFNNSNSNSNFANGNNSSEFSKEIFKKNEDKVVIQIWDASGNQKYRSILHCYYRGATGFIAAFDITNRQSFELLSKGNYLQAIKRFTNPEVNAPFLLVGTHSDKASERTVSQEEALEFAKKFGMKYCECSSKSGENVEYTFSSLISLMHDALNTRANTVIESTNNSNSNSNTTTPTNAAAREAALRQQKKQATESAGSWCGIWTAFQFIQSWYSTSTSSSTTHSTKAKMNPGFQVDSTRLDVTA